MRPAGDRVMHTAGQAVMIGPVLFTIAGLLVGVINQFFDNAINRPGTAQAPLPAIFVHAAGEIVGAADLFSSAIADHIDVMDDHVCARALFG